MQARSSTAYLSGPTAFGYASVWPFCSSHSAFTGSLYSSGNAKPSRRAVTPLPPPFHPVIPHRRCQRPNCHSTQLTDQTSQTPAAASALVALPVAVPATTGHPPCSRSPLNHKPDPHPSLPQSPHSQLWSFAVSSTPTNRKAQSLLHLCLFLALRTARNIASWDFGNTPDLLAPPQTRSYAFCSRHIQ